MWTIGEPPAGILCCLPPVRSPLAEPKGEETKIAERCDVAIGKGVSSIQPEHADMSPPNVLGTSGSNSHNDQIVMLRRTTITRAVRPLHDRASGSSLVNDRLWSHVTHSKVETSSWFGIGPLHLIFRTLHNI